MAEKVYKTNKMWDALNDLSNSIYGRSTTDSIGADVCVRCGKPATAFKDEISKTEFGISGLCQECQDFVFAPPPDEEE